MRNKVTNVVREGCDIGQLGYYGVFLALLLEAIGIPFPSETILIATGAEIARGVFHFLPLWLLATVGNIVGSNIAYAIGRYLGRPVILRYGRYVRITEKRLHAVEVRFQRYQFLFIVIGKFIAFVRIAIPYLAGINKVSFWLFNILNTLAALAWSALFLLLGHTIDEIWKHDKKFLLSHLYITIPIVILILGGLYWHHRRSKRALQHDIDTDTSSGISG